VKRRLVWELSPLKSLSDSFSKHPRVQTPGPREHQQELLATVAHRDVFAPHRASQELAHDPQHLITDDMTQGVVDQLEVV
jgi:hypothetical protein